MPNSPSLRPQWSDISQQAFRERYQQLESAYDLADFWGVPTSQLTYYAFHVDKRNTYRTFSFMRRNGKERRIDAPNKTLKYLQRILHESLMKIYGPHPAVHGFLPKHSIVCNAKQHVERKFVLNIDIADFFPSITRKRIYGRLVSPPYSFHSNIANIIGSLATNAYWVLPQGSPSSPVIANMITAGLDRDIANLCGMYRCWYSRYADDITISTSRRQMPPDLARYPNALGTGQVIIGDRLTHLIEYHGFEINHQKSRLQSHWTRQLCTGLVVNTSKLSPPKSYIRRLRSLIDHWQRRGWQHAAMLLHEKERRPLFGSRQELMNHAIGRINYLGMVRGNDDAVMQRLKQSIGALP